MLGPIDLDDEPAGAPDEVRPRLQQRQIGHGLVEGEERREVGVGADQPIELELHDALRMRPPLGLRQGQDVRGRLVRSRSSGFGNRRARATDHLPGAEKNAMRRGIGRDILGKDKHGDIRMPCQPFERPHQARGDRCGAQRHGDDEAIGRESQHQLRPLDLRRGMAYPRRRLLQQALHEIPGEGARDAGQTLRELGETDRQMAWPSASSRNSEKVLATPKERPEFGDRRRKLADGTLDDLFGGAGRRKIEAQHGPCRRPRCQEVGERGRIEAREQTDVVGAHRRDETRHAGRLECRHGG